MKSNAIIFILFVSLFGLISISGNGRTDGNSPSLRAMAGYGRWLAENELN